MKKVIVSLLIGCIISFSIAYAEDIIKVQKAALTILVDGNQFKTNKPILTVGDTAYVPLRDFSDCFKANVTWNSEGKRIEVTNAPYFDENSVLTNKFKIQMNGTQGGYRLEENKYLVHFGFNFANISSTPINIDLSKDFKLRDSQDKIVNTITNEIQTVEPGQSKSIKLQFEVKGEDLKEYLNFIYKPSKREYSIPIFLGKDNFN
ncbi:stalk domain-containing protein [Pseudobacteroides cellulosolvens]|uniref:Copper amine oxidase-like domain-containing protein n=1 Tax=Pseudobacteroides cellulosolvens ATCC 35603 = DSM 2933 TaxID=398512 RepID=A0A0L6JKP4_9FIRM|nr:stalk domain-containing protein [Pseudobacteroides cellulosolvens]KNY26406.1 copper amine oxidase-like domain-containing protein [Pseudobacteroides cellulosolvens ATCC 35603 = DSM 2933]